MFIKFLIFFFTKNKDREIFVWPIFSNIFFGHHDIFWTTDTSLKTLQLPVTYFSASYMSSHCCNCSIPNLIVFFFSKTIICEPTASHGLLLWALHPLPVPAPGAREVARGSPLHPHPVGENAIPAENPTPQESAAGVPGSVLPLLPGSSWDVYSRYSFPLHEMIPVTFNQIFSIRCLIG